MNPERFRYGRTCDVRIHNSHLIAQFLHGHRQHGGDRGFSHAAFPTDNPDDLLDTAQYVWFLYKICWHLSSLCTLFRAAAAVLIAISAHFHYPFLSLPGKVPAEICLSVSAGRFSLIRSAFCEIPPPPGKSSPPGLWKAPYASEASGFCRKYSL